MLRFKNARLNDILKYGDCELDDCHDSVKHLIQIFTNDSLGRSTRGNKETSFACYKYMKILPMYPLSKDHSETKITISFLLTPPLLHLGDSKSYPESIPKDCSTYTFVLDGSWWRQNLAQPSNALKHKITCRFYCVVLWNLHFFNQTTSALLEAVVNYAFDISVERMPCFHNAVAIGMLLPHGCCPHCHRPLIYQRHPPLPPAPFPKMAKNGEGSSKRLFLYKIGRYVLKVFPR